MGDKHLVIYVGRRIAISTLTTIDQSLQRVEFPNATDVFVSKTLLLPNSNDITSTIFSLLSTIWLFLFDYSPIYDYIVDNYSQSLNISVRK